MEETKSATVTEVKEKSKRRIVGTASLINSLFDNMLAAPTSEEGVSADTIDKKLERYMSEAFIVRKRAVH